jgi:hypothetical protein
VFDAIVRAGQSGKVEAVAEPVGRG